MSIGRRPAVLGDQRWPVKLASREDDDVTHDDERRAHSTCRLNCSIFHGCS
jgi:hypothetical protein